QLPALRTRRADIPLLAAHFVRLVGPANNLPNVRLAADALEALGQHSYPGNVRELRNLIERLVILSPDDAISGADVAKALGMSNAPGGGGLYRPGVPFRLLAEA